MTEPMSDGNDRPTCDTCKWWVALNEEMVRGRIIRPGQCHLHPPVVAAVWRWPLVYSGEFCGAHAPHETLSDEPPLATEEVPHG